MQARGHKDEVESRMDNYISEYVKQREERAALKQINDTSTHGRILLGVSLHSVNNILDSSLRGETKEKENSLTRATSAIDLMERSNNSRKSSQGDLESNKSEKLSSLAQINDSLRSAASEPIQDNNSNEVQDEPWRDN